MLRAIGLTEDEIEGNLKEQPRKKLCGKTPRHAMITLGTEWGRRMIGQDFWVLAAMRSVEGFKGPFVFDDCRFPNEADMIKRAGGVIVRVDRNTRMTAAEVHEAHSSEAGQDDIVPDYIIENNGTLADLDVTVATLAGALSGHAA
jgi:hypothetical protein